MRALRSAIVVGVVLAFVGCGGSAQRNLPAVQPDSAAPTVGALPTGVSLLGGWKLVAQGDTSGVRWLLSQGSDPTMGTCRAFDSDPPLQTGGPAPRPGLPSILGGYKRQCSSAALRLPSTPPDVRGLWSTVDLVRLDRSVRGDFSVVAGAAAIGVESVTLHFADGSTAVVRPSASRTFVAISRPARPAPSSFDVKWSGGLVTCRPVEEGPNLGCGSSR